MKTILVINWSLVTLIQTYLWATTGSLIFLCAAILALVNVMVWAAIDD